MFSWFGKNGADNGLHLSELGLLIFAGLVAIGLVGEYRKDKDERWKGFSDTFELLVIIGVIGEVVFDGLIFGFSGRLSVLQDAEVENAISAAVRATNAAATAITESGKARKEAELAAKATQEMRLRADKFERETINLKIQYGQLASRHVDTKALGKALDKSDLNVSRITVVFPKASELGEAEDLAKEIVAAFKANGWPATTSPWLGSVPMPAGVSVCTNDSRSLKLLKALDDAQITHGGRIEVDKNGETGGVPNDVCQRGQIVVGPHPPTP